MPDITVTLPESAIPLLIEALTAQRDELDAQIKRLTAGLLGNEKGNGRRRGGDIIDNGREPNGFRVGNGRKGKKRGPKPKAKKGTYKDIDRPTLLELLKKADGKTVARKQLIASGYNLNSAIAIAKADKATFSFTKKGAQGTVTLKK